MHLLFLSISSICHILNKFKYIKIYYHQFDHHVLSNVSLSHWDHFEFAQALIPFRLDAYLMKPIKNEDVFNVLNTILSNLNNEELVMEDNYTPEDKEIFKNELDELSNAVRVILDKTILDDTQKAPKEPTALPKVAVIMSTSLL